ncbi:hypothetical protein GEMRC1_004464 [Eukaryota sp. GEM-RC1]
MSTHNHLFPSCCSRCDSTFDESTAVTSPEQIKGSQRRLLNFRKHLKQKSISLPSSPHFHYIPRPVPRQSTITRSHILDKIKEHKREQAGLSPVPSSYTIERQSSSVSASMANSAKVVSTEKLKELRRKEFTDEANNVVKRASSYYKPVHQRQMEKLEKQISFLTSKTSKKLLSSLQHDRKREIQNIAETSLNIPVDEKDFDIDLDDCCSFPSLDSPPSIKSDRSHSSGSRHSSRAFAPLPAHTYTSPKVATSPMMTQSQPLYNSIRKDYVRDIFSVQEKRESFLTHLVLKKVFPLIVLLILNLCFLVSLLTKFFLKHCHRKGNLRGIR